MKEKLLKIKEALQSTVSLMGHTRECEDSWALRCTCRYEKTINNTKESLALLDCIISMLDSEELLSQYEGLALVDKSYISKIVEQIIHTRYTGMASFPVDHPEYKNEQFKSFNTAFCSKLFDKDATDLVEHLNNSKAAIESIME